MLPSVTLAAAGDPMGHVLDKGVAGPLTMNTITLVVAGLLTIWCVNAAARRIDTGRDGEGSKRYVTSNPFAHMLEVIVTYLRATVIHAQLGKKDGDRFLPFLLTVFFFILFNNLLGLVPLLDLQHLIGSFWGDPHFAVVGGTATGRIAVTAALALIAFVVWNAAGLRSAGVGGWLAHFTGGAPWYIWVIMIPVEIMGAIVKPAALAVRLFANMTAGHVLLAVIVIFTASAPAALGLLGLPITLVAALGAIAITMLEIFVAFLQAFIFMFLTTLFIAQMVHHHHEEDAHAESYDGSHPAIEDDAAPVAA